VFHNPKYEGRISLPDNTDDVWALALLATGVSDWTSSPMTSSRPPPTGCARRM
jgi:hypothetical protein